MSKKQRRGKSAPEWIRALVEMGSTLPVLSARERLFLEILVIPNIERLASRALQLTHDPNNAKDLLQEALLRAWEKFDKYKFDKYKGGKSAYSWLNAIMTNLYISQLRRQKALEDKIGPIHSLEELKVTSEEGEEALSPEEIIKGDEDPLEKIMREEISGVIVAALLELPEPMRHVFLLRVLAGFSEKEVMEILGIKKETVRSRLSRARKLLRKKLERYFNKQKRNLPPSK